MADSRLRAITLSVPWNLFLLTLSGFLASFSLCSIARPHEFVSSGFYGTAMLLNYVNSSFNIAGLYVLFNIPCLILGWKMLSRRFMLYTIYCVAVTAITTQFIPWGDAGIKDPLLAAVATGICCGVGTGIALKSLGSDGGLNIISLVLHSRYNINVGTLNIAYNGLLYLTALLVIDVDKVLYSVIITYLASSLMNYFMSAFDQRKMVLVISDRYDEIAQSILRHLGRGCTLMNGQGAFTQRPRMVLLTVVHNIQLKRLEELIYAVDANAFVIIENTQMVLGKGFSQRRKY